MPPSGIPPPSATIDAFTPLGRVPGGVEASKSPEAPRAPGAAPPRHFASMEHSNERTVCGRLAEREDRADPRDDHRAGVMLVRLRALRQRLLRLLRRPWPFLVRCLGGHPRRVLGRALPENRTPPPAVPVAVCPGPGPSRRRPSARPPPALP